MSDASPKASVEMQASAARLSAVQALYQSVHAPKATADISSNYLERYSEMHLEEGRLASPDKPLFNKIISGVMDRRDDLQEILKGHKSESQKDKSFDAILNTILLCGIFELMSHGEIDAPIIINDYVNVTHAFYDKPEAGLVNAILDSAQKTLR